MQLQLHYSITARSSFVDRPQLASASSHNNMAAAKFGGSLLLLLLFATLIMDSVQAAPASPPASSPAPPPPRPYKKSKLSYYVHVKRGHPSMGLLLPAINTTYSNGLGFTSIFALNMTQKAANTSQVLGYARGYTVDVSYTADYFGFESEVISYDDGRYKGTVHFQAMLDGSDPGEVAVLGGTGSFRGVRGWGLVTQVLLSPPDVVYLHTLYFMGHK